MQITAGGFRGADVAAQSMLRKMLNLCGIRPNIVLRGDMSQLPVPTLFAWGDRDAFDPPSSGQSLAREMPHARLEIITDAGHVPWIDQPNPVAHALTRYLSGATPGDAGASASET
jgi:2-hydroxy-6-oxonona-2,4-dienedioate hydrolase